MVSLSHISLQEELINSKQPQYSFNMNAATQTNTLTEHPLMKAMSLPGGATFQPNNSTSYIDVSNGNQVADPRKTKTIVILCKRSLSHENIVCNVLQPCINYTSSYWRHMPMDGHKLYVTFDTLADAVVAIFLLKNCVIDNHRMYGVEFIDSDDLYYCQNYAKFPSGAPYLDFFNHGGREKVFRKCKANYPIVKRIVTSSCEIIDLTGEDTDTEVETETTDEKKRKWSQYLKYDSMEDSDTGF